MLIDVVERAEQTLFLARPQGETDRAPRPNSKLANDPRRLHDDKASRAIVSGAVTRDPAVEVCAGHNVASLRVRSRNVGNDVVGAVIVVEPTYLVIDFQHWIIAHFCHAGDAAIIFGGNLDCWKNGRTAHLVLIALARQQLAVAVGDPCAGNSAFAREKLVELAFEIHALDERVLLVWVELGHSVSVTLGNVGLLEPPKRRFFWLVPSTGKAGKYDPAGKL